MEHPEAKFVRGDRVRVTPESTEELEHLFPEGFETYEGIVRSVRLDYTGGWGTRPAVFKAWVYTVSLDQKPTAGGLYFLETDLTLVRPYVVGKLDEIVKGLEDRIADIRQTQAEELKRRGLSS